MSAIVIACCICYTILQQCFIVNVFAFGALTLLVGLQEGHVYVWSDMQVICTDATATPSSLTPVKPEWFTF